jgi:hypothetical protein
MRGLDPIRRLSCLSLTLLLVFHASCHTTEGGGGAPALPPSRGSFSGPVLSVLHHGFRLCTMDSASAPWIPPLHHGFRHCALQSHRRQLRHGAHGLRQEFAAPLLLNLTMLLGLKNDQITLISVTTLKVPPLRTSPTPPSHSSWILPPR